MREIGVIEAADDLGALLDQVERGEEVIITRHGRHVARLIAAADRPTDRDDARAAAARIVANRAGKTLGGTSIRELIDEGRP